MKNFRLENIQCWQGYGGAVASLQKTPWFSVAELQIAGSGPATKKFCVQGYCFEVTITEDDRLFASGNTAESASLAPLAGDASGSVFFDPSMVKVQKADQEGAALGGSFGGCFELIWD